MIKLYYRECNACEAYIFLDCFVIYSKDHPSYRIIDDRTYNMLLTEISYVSRVEAYILSRTEAMSLFDICNTYKGRIKIKGSKRLISKLKLVI